MLNWFFLIQHFLEQNTFNILMGQRAYNWMCYKTYSTRNQVWLRPTAETPKYPLKNSFFTIWANFAF